MNICTHIDILIYTYRICILIHILSTGIKILLSLTVSYFIITFTPYKMISSVMHSSSQRDSENKISNEKHWE